MIDAPLRREDFDRAAACVRAHPGQKALGAFAYDVLTTQAEGRSLFAGQKFMAQRAEGHAVDRERAVTDLGNLLTILERGPSARAELALIACFAAVGFDAALAAASDSERHERVEKLVTYLDWLELATPYRLMPCLERLVSAEHKGLLYSALAAAVLRDDSADTEEPELSRRARNAARLSALGAADSDQAQDELRRVQAGAQDPASRALCALLAKSTPQASGATTHNPRLAGVAAPITRRPWVALLRWLSGYALLHWGLRALAFLARVEREVEVELEGRVLHLRRRTSWLGRTVRSLEAVYVLDRVSGAYRRARYALLRTLAGMLSLACGILLGGHLAFDAAHGGASLMLAAAAFVVALGSGLDLALDVLGPAASGHVQLQIDLSDARSIKIAGVTPVDADRFLEALSTALTAHVRLAAQ